MIAPRSMLTPAAVVKALLGTLCAFGALALLCSDAALGAAPVVGETWASNVASGSATLAAQVNPEGVETTYRFEYGTSEAYGTAVPTPEGGAGAGVGALTVWGHTQNLTPRTTYHYRVVATSAEGTVYGSDHTFTTQSVGGELILPDGRQWEIVSPLQKDGAEVLGIGGASLTSADGDATQASEDGSEVTYITNNPVGQDPPGNTYATQLLSTRGSGGWSTENIAIPHLHAVEASGAVNFGEEFVRFSGDLSQAIVQSPHPGIPEPPLAPEIHQEVDGGSTTGNEVYIRNDATGVFRAALTAEPLPDDVIFLGASPDLGSVVFSTAAVGLDSAHPTGGGLYDWSAGQLHLVNVLPNGTPASGTVLLGGAVAKKKGSAVTSRFAVSSDGGRIVWSGEGSLYSSNIAAGTTVQVDATDGGAGPAGGGTFLAASNDGARVFFTDTHELTAGAASGGLYMFDLAASKLTDLTPGVGGAAVGKFFGANEAGTALYEMSTAVLTSTPNARGEVAQTGASNTYLLRESPDGSGSWKATYITNAVEEGFPGELSAKGPLATQTLRIAPNGNYFAFMSQGRPTGYDNTDAVGGAPDEEVYLYDAETNALVCASCNPTGARPNGEYDAPAPFGPPMDPWRMWTKRWLGASIPGFTPDGSAASTGYQPRYLSSSGRLFFDSADALVPQDVNGKDDVYEYEPVGVGGCKATSSEQASGQLFVPADEGCVGLISSGSGNTNSAFFDASASGEDVFFTTQEGLVPQDQDDTYDLYDARVCTAKEPCSSSVSSAPACTTADACRPAPSPQPAVFGAPASATFSGTGNVASIPVTTVAKPKAKRKHKRRMAEQVRARKLAKALATCRKLNVHRRAARETCEGRARKQFRDVMTSGRRSK